MNPVRRFGLMVLILGSLSFGSNLANGAAESTAEQTLAQISGVIRSLNSNNFQFVQTRTLSILSRPVISSGFLQYETEQGMCWIIQKPYLSVLKINQGGIREVLPDGSERLLLPSGNPLFETFSRVYMGVLLGDFQGLSQDLEMQPGVAAAGWDLKLIPLQKTGMDWLQSIVLSGDAQSTHIVLHEKNGDRNELQFAPVQTIEATRQCW